MESIRVIWKYI